ERPALIRCGYGQERNRNGGSASLAILALPAVGGKFAERGGGYMMSNSASWGITNTWTGAQEPATRVINMNRLGRALLESTPPINLLFVYNSNPAVTTPDQRRVLRGLEREERDPRGELEEMLNVLDRLPGTTGDEVRDAGTAKPPFDGRPIQFRDVFPRTVDQKIDLYPEALAKESSAGLYVYHPDPATSEFPLALISPASEKTISSTLAEIPRPEVRLLMHPEDAEARGIADGDEIRIFNALGEVTCTAALGAWIRRGTVSLPKGLWRTHTLNGYTGTSLVPDTLTDVAGGACFNDARVQVAKV